MKKLECSKIKIKNIDYANSLLSQLNIYTTAEQLLKDYSSIFVSFEDTETRRRLRIIGAKKGTNKKINLLVAGKKDPNLEDLKEKSELLCKILQQVKNLDNVIKVQKEIDSEKYITITKDFGDYKL